MPVRLVPVTPDEVRAARALCLTPRLGWTSDGVAVPHGVTHDLVGDVLARVADGDAPLVDVADVVRDAFAAVADAGGVHVERRIVEDVAARVAARLGR